jgi:hypothetical protein
MGIRHKLCLCAVCVSFITFGAIASADGQAAFGAGVPPAGAVASGIRLPVPYVERGITNPVGILSPELDFGISKIGLLGGNGAPIVGTMALGSGYSFTDDFGLRGTVFVLQFNQPFQLASAAMGATYRFLKGNFEAGAALDWIYQTPSNNNGNAGMVILPSVPLHVHFGKAARLDITPTLPISTAGVYVPPAVALGGGKTTVGLDVPVQLAFQIVDPLRLGLTSGFDMTFNPDSTNFPPPPATPLRFGDTFFIPLGFQVGVTVPGPNGPILDMTPFFEWPSLFVPGVRSGTSAVQAGVWLTGVNFTTYFYL